MKLGGANLPLLWRNACLEYSIARRRTFFPARLSKKLRRTAAAIEGGGVQMKIIIRGTPEEISTLVVELQRPISLAVTDESIKGAAQAICDRQRGAQERFDNLH